MFNFKKTALTGALTAGALLLTACGNADTPTTGTGGGGGGATGAPATEVTNIHVVFGKMEVTTEFENMLRIFNAEHEHINISLLPTEDGQGVVERVRLQYAAGDAVTLMHLDAGFVAEFEHLIRDLSDQPWVANAMEGVLDFVTRPDGRVLGLPASVESFGIVYNRDVMRSALGQDFDHSSVRTVDQFQALLQTIEAAGYNPIITTPSLDWSLGFHLMNSFLATQAEDLDTNLAFLDALLAGTVDLYNNPRFQQWMGTLDIMLDYSMFSHAPLDPQFDDGIINMADGNVAMWFQGNWIYPPMHNINPHGDFGFMAVPMSNDPNDFANRRISIDVPQFWVVDQYLSTPAQQDAALTFLNWMVSTNTGQYHSAIHLGLAPVMYGAAYVPQDSLSFAMIDYLERGEALPWVISYFSSGLLTVTGAGVQQYALGMIDAQQLATIFETEFYNLP